MSFLDDMLGGKINKEAMESQGKDSADHFERKIKAHDWIKGVSDLDPEQVEKEYLAAQAAEARALGKTAAHEFKTDEEVINGDYDRDVKALSDYALAEMLAELRCNKEQNTQEMFSEAKEKAKKEVASSREKAEKALLDLVPEHTMLDWKKAFEKFSKDAKVEQPTEKDLYEPKAPEAEHNFENPTEDKFKVPSEEKKTDVMIGVGREADERTDVTAEAGVVKESITEGLGKVASVEKKADYEGWKNSETWQVALWLDNDQALNAASAELAQTVKDPSQLAQSLKSLVEEAKPDLGSSLWDDMINWAMAEVDWMEVANHFSSKFAESSKLPKVEKVADKVKNSPANDKGNLAMPEGKKTAGDKPEEAVDGTTLPADDKALGSKSDQSAEANSPEKGDKAKDIESVNKKAHCGHCGEDKKAAMCPACGSEGKDMANGKADHMSCMACGTCYGSEKVADQSTGKCNDCQGPMEPGADAFCDACSAREAFGGIKSKASKAEVIKKVAEIQSPWLITKDEAGNDVIARRDMSVELNKESEEDKKDELQK